LIILAFFNVTKESQQMHSLFLALSLLFISLPLVVKAEESLENRIKSLESQLAELKDTLAKTSQNNATFVNKEQPNVTIDTNGLVVSSDDKQASFSLGAYAHMDSRFFINDDSDLATDSFLVRRARLDMRFKYKDMSLVFVPDFGGDSPSIQNAYVDYKPLDAFGLQLGKTKIPFSLEQLTSSNSIDFTELSLTRNFIPSRDIGIMAYGKPIDELSYQIGIFNGALENTSSNSDNGDGKDFIGRVFTTPFNDQKGSLLEKLGVGVAASIAQREGTTGETELGSYRTPAQSTFFRYDSNSVADGTFWRVSPQAYYFYGPFGLMGEYVISAQDVTNNQTSTSLQHGAWNIQASLMLTGEDNTYNSWPIIHSPFDPAHNQWGAWKLAARYGELSLDDETFPVFANLSSSASKAQNIGVALSGYLDSYIRLTMDYERSAFEGGAIIGDRETEHAITSRVTVAF
jgi:phosphate-selective porin OprO/OprP